MSKPLPNPEPVKTPSPRKRGEGWGEGPLVTARRLQNELKLPLP